MPYVPLRKGPVCLLCSISGKDVLSIRETTPVPAQPSYLTGSHRLAHEYMWTHTAWIQSVNFVQGLLFNSSRHVFYTAGSSPAARRQPCCWRKPLSSLPAPDHRSCPGPARFLLSAWALVRDLVQGAGSHRSWSGPLKSFFNSFFPDNSALCSGPTNASREWGVWVGKEWLGHMHNQSKPNLLAVERSQRIWRRD